MRVSDSPWVTAAAVLLLGGPLLAAWWLWPQETSGPCTVTHRSPLPGVDETSGLAVSRRTPGVIWTHNDSGNDAVLFAVDSTGALRGRVRLPIRTRDWEDVSAARCPSGDCLYIADIGDNGQSRPRIEIYRVPEPAPGDTVTSAPDVFTATYADGPHNAEAMFVTGDELVIITRDRTGGVYRGTLPSGGSREVTFRRIGQLGLAAVTDAEAFDEGRSVVVRTSHEAALYRTADVLRGSAAPYLRISLDGLREPQGEGVAVSEGTLFLSSEGRRWTRGGLFISLRCQFR